jgi:hypothetical protein
MFSCLGIDPKHYPLSMEELILNITRLPDDDDEIQEQLTPTLRRELIELDVEKVDVVRSGEASEGTRIGEMISREYLYCVHDIRNRTRSSCSP